MEKQRNSTIMVNDIYDLIDQWKRAGIQEYEVSAAGIFVFTDNIMRRINKKEDGIELIDRIVKKVCSWIERDKEEKNSKTKE